MMKFSAIWLAVCAILLASAPAWAVDPIDVTARPAIDLLAGAERVESDGPGLSFSTAPDAEGIVRRVEVRSQTTGNDAASSWLIFALANSSDTQVERLVVAPHARLAGSGWWRPDMGRARLEAITPSEGFALERQADPDADIFRVSLEAGAVVTFAAQVADGATGIPRLTLWEPDARKDSTNALTLYRGVVLGIAGLIAVVLTVLLIVKGSAVLVALAGLGWAILGVTAVQLGFLDRLLSPGIAEEALWRTWLELALAAGLLTFVHVYLSLRRWDRRALWVTAAWLLVLVGAAVYATVDASVAAGIARVSLAGIAGIGALLTAFLAVRGYDRALMIAPTWLLLAAWVFAGWSIVAGRIDNDVAQPALLGGLVLLLLMLSFTVGQQAFKPVAVAPVTDGSAGALALDGAGDAFFDWDIAAGTVRTGDSATAALGLPAGALNDTLDGWPSNLHADDRDRFRTTIAALTDQGKGRLDQDLRLRGAESGTLGSGQYRWFRLRLRPMLGTDGEVARCIGTLMDVNTERTSRERLLHDAVHDNLTGLPNREIFLDRLRAGLTFAKGAKGDAAINPAVFLLDLDRFAHINETFGLSTGDNVIVSMARRLLNVIKPQDCLARLSGDRFALLVMSEPDPEGLAVMADRLQRAVRLPVAFGSDEIAVTASIGLVAADSETGTNRAEGMIGDAEIAVEEAKRLGGDRVEPFRPIMRRDVDRDYHVENDLRRALDRHQIEMHYQPIVDLGTDKIAGFEALMRWRSPERGLVSPEEFIPMAERNGIIVQLGVFALDQAMEELARWSKASRDDLFVSVNISSRQLMRHDLIGDVKGVLDRADVAPHRLKLELTESMVMDNPEQASVVLQRVKELGVTLALDDFGTGYSSLSQLTRFPFDTIKIDRSLVTGSGDGNTTGGVVLKSLVAMAHDLGMDVVAEGLETETDAEAVRSLGCRYGQGFLHGPSMEPEDAVAALKRQKKSRKAASKEDVAA